MRLSRFTLSIGALNNNNDVSNSIDQITGSLERAGDIVSDSKIRAFITLRDEKDSATDSFPSQGNYSVMLPQNFGNTSSGYFNITGSLSAYTDPTVSSSQGTRYAHGDVLVIAESIE